MAGMTYIAIGTRNFWVFQHSSHLEYLNRAANTSSLSITKHFYCFSQHRASCILRFSSQNTTFNIRCSASYNPHITTLWWVTDKVHNYMKERCKLYW
jgi:hypothetical protein